MAPPELHAMSFNIRRRVRNLNRRSPDLWSRRRPLVRRLLDVERPTLLGVQESLPDQVRFMAEGLGSDYRWIGRGRSADGSGEHCPIFYDARRLHMRRWTQQALSGTPDEPGSRTWGNLLPRAATIAEMTDTATGSDLLVVNTHLDHLSARSRLRSAKMLRDVVLAADRPVVLMGDANAAVGSDPYQMLTDGGVLHDSWAVAATRRTPSWGTYSRYREPVRDGRRIDWLLVSPQIQVRAAAVNAARYDGAAASDHEPVQAVLRIEKR